MRQALNRALARPPDLRVAARDRPSADPAVLADELPGRLTVEHVEPRFHLGHVPHWVRWARFFCRGGVADSGVMTGAVGGAGQDAGPRWRWDVALSFAGAQRDYVEQVASELKARGVRCFYDADEQIDLWGKYLAGELPAIYGEQAAAAVVVFASAEYAARDWTRLERRAALNRAVRERREYVLPARFDDTPLPGLLSDMVAVDLRGRPRQQFAAMIADKLARLAITAPAPSADAGDPARYVEPAPPAGAVRAGDAGPRRLGVHAAISVAGVPDHVLPEYVPRDVDAAALEAAG